MASSLYLHKPCPGIFSAILSEFTGGDVISSVPVMTNVGLHNEHHGMNEGGGGMAMGMEKREQHISSPATTNNAAEISIVNGAATLGNKAFSPNHLKIKVGTTVTWANNDNNIHTITSGTANTPNAGQVFDSGLTSLISPSKTYSHKFTNTGEFSYFCRLHPTMVGEIEVIQ